MCNSKTQCLCGLQPEKSLPLNRRWRLARHVIRHAVDATHFVDDASRHFLEQRIRQLGPVGGHEVAGLNSTQGHHIVVSAAIAHHAHALDRQEHGEGLAGQVVPSFASSLICEVVQLFDEDGVGSAQQVGVFFFHFAQNAHPEAWAWERVAIHHLAGQS